MEEKGSAKPFWKFNLLTFIRAKKIVPFYKLSHSLKSIQWKQVCGVAKKKKKKKFENHVSTNWGMTKFHSNSYCETIK